MMLRSICRSRRTRICALAALGFISLACTGCYLPPFDEKLSESQQFAEKLAHIARLGPVYIDDWRFKGGYFLPSREFDASSSRDGYWLRQDGTDLIAAYMNDGVLNANAHISDNVLGTGFVAFPLTELQVSGLSLSSPKRGLFAIFGSDPDTRMPALATESDFGLGQNLYPLTITPTPSGSIVGAGYRIQDSIQDRVSILFQTSSSPPIFSGGSTAATSVSPWTAGGILLSTGTDSSGTVPALEPGAFFDHCAGNSRYYVSGYREDDSTLYSAYWQGSLASPPVALPGMEARIAAILSTGQLLAAGDETMYLHDAEGGLLASFTTGSMRFAYEYYDSAAGAWYCYFTRAFRGSGNDYNRVLVDVYRCPSIDLASLGD